MKMLNAEIENFANFLMEIELEGRKSRLRTRFVKVLQERLKLIQEEHKAILEQYTAKDEEGELKTIDTEDGGRAYDVQDYEAFQKEYQDLLVEEFVIDQTQERKQMLEAVREGVLNTDMVFKGKDALVFDRYCEIVEQVEYE